MAIWGAAKCSAPDILRLEPLRWVALAHARSISGRARRRRERRARTPPRVLLRLGQRRRLENGERRPHLDADLRLPADRIDWRDRGRTVEPRYDLRRQRRIDAARLGRLRK